MTISEPSNIDDLLAVCLHFAEGEKTFFGDIFKRGGGVCSLNRDERMYRPI
jgi:hypothetical protein